MKRLKTFKEFMNENFTADLEKTIQNDAKKMVKNAKGKRIKMPSSHATDGEISQTIANFAQDTGTGKEGFRQANSLADYKIKNAMKKKNAKKKENAAYTKAIPPFKKVPTPAGS